jgi:hypothetical protein
LSFAAVFGLFATACETDPCKDVETGEHGTCLEGIVTCDPGYEKNADGLCNDEVRAKFVHAPWTVSDTCSQSGTASYTVSITTSTASILEVKITNFWGTFVNQATATVDGNTINIARQQPDNDNYLINGSGTINDARNEIRWNNYNISDETGATPVVDVCTATWRK